jgi:hypothetical protein
MNNILCNNILQVCLVWFSSNLTRLLGMVVWRYVFILTCFMFVEQELLDFIRTYHAHMAQLFIKVWHFLLLKEKENLLHKSLKILKGSSSFLKSVNQIIFILLSVSRQKLYYVRMLHLSSPPVFSGVRVARSLVLILYHVKSKPPTTGWMGLTLETCCVHYGLHTHIDPCVNLRSTEIPCKVNSE